MIYRDETVQEGDSGASGRDETVLDGGSMPSSHAGAEVERKVLACSQEERSD